MIAISPLYAVGDDDSGKKHDLWPVAGATAGEGIIYRPQDYIGSEHNFASLFISAGEGTDVLAPRDGIVTRFSYSCRIGLKSSMSFRADHPDSIIEHDELTRSQISDIISERMNVDIDPRFVGMMIALKVDDGETYYITGLRPTQIFNTGYKVRRGDVIGKVGYAYRAIDQPSILFSRSVNSKPADPMSIFGLKTSFIPPTVKTIDYLKHRHAAEDLRNDFSVFRSSLEEGHPGLYDYTPKEEMDRIFDSILEKIQGPMTSREFWLSLLPAMHAIRDSHTALLGRRYKETDNSLPPILFGIEDFDDSGLGDVKVFRAAEGFSQFIGMTVKTIDGRKVEDLIPEVRNLIYGTDGFIKSQSDRLMLSSFWRYYSTIGLKMKGDELTLEFSDGSREVFVYEHRSYEDFSPAWNRGSPDNNHFETRRIDAATAVLDINTFQLYDKDLDDIADFMMRISSDSTRNLIIDVRDNPGGSPEALARIFSYIADRPFRGAMGSIVKKRGSYDFFKHTYNYSPDENGLFLEYEAIEGEEGYYLPEEHFPLTAPDDSIQFGGRVLVLTNEFSISAATIFPGLIHRNGRGVIVGRETGSTYYQLNALKFANVNLGISGLELVIPLVKEIFAEKDSDDIPWGRGVLPDYPFDISFEEFTTPGDKILDHAIALIPELEEKERLERDLIEKEIEEKEAAVARRKKLITYLTTGLVLVIAAIVGRVINKRR